MANEAAPLKTVKYLSINLNGVDDHFRPEANANKIAVGTMPGPHTLDPIFFVASQLTSVMRVDTKEDHVFYRAGVLMPGGHLDFDLSAPPMTTLDGCIVRLSLENFTFYQQLIGTPKQHNDVYIPFLFAQVFHGP